MERTRFEEIEITYKDAEDLVGGKQTHSDESCKYFYIYDSDDYFLDKCRKTNDLCIGRKSCGYKNR